MFNKRIKIKQVLAEGKPGDAVVVMGWVRTFRNNQFIALNDGSTNNNLQVMAELGLLDEATIKRITTGASLRVEGTLAESLGKGQHIELKAATVEILGDCDAEKYPLQPKKHSLEFLREIAHLRFRTNTFSSVFRVRHALAFAIHKFFNERGFVYLHTPIITSSDAEGAGEMFRVTTLPIRNIQLRNKSIEAKAEIYATSILRHLNEEELREFNQSIKGINRELSFKHLLTARPAQIQSLVSSLKGPLKRKYDILIGRFTELSRLLSEFFTYEGNMEVYAESYCDLFFSKPGAKVQRRFNKRHYPMLAFSYFNFSTVNNKVRVSPDSEVDFADDFFGKSTNLTVSGQLEGELGAMAFGEIYTFGPTFRAENSNTTRHLAEFWMIEPEMAFCDIEDNMDLAEEFIRYLIQYVMDNNRDDLTFLDQRLAEEEKQKPQQDRAEMGLVEKLEFVLNNRFERITYTDAINILLDSPAYKKKKFKYDVQWGIDLQSEHERYLVEKHFKKPVIVTGYPAAIKAFYMRLNDNCEPGKQTVAAMDILAPGIGEIVGGSQREERLEKLEARMNDMHIPTEEMSWYLDTRRFGSVPHAGFGLGFERMVQFVTGMTNIRDVIAFARTPNNCEF